MKTYFAVTSVVMNKGKALILKKSLTVPVLEKDLKVLGLNQPI